MQVTAEHTSPCTLVLDITVDEEQVIRTFDLTYKEFSKHVNVPGFRPGKAPRVLVERHVNQDRVRQQALERLVRETYLQALEEQAITPLRGRGPEIEPTDLEDKKPYNYKATIPLEPQITLGEYTGLTVERPLFTVTDAVVEKRIEALREERSRLERITDRGVQAGDILIAETVAVVEGEEGEPQPPRRKLINMGSNIPGFDEALLEMNIGDERTFTLPYPDDFDEEEKRGKSATHTVKLVSISGKKKPELNDEFVQSVGGGQTVEELYANVRENLTAEAEQFSNQLAEQRLFDEILQRSTIYFPEVLIKEEVEDDLRRLAQDLRQRNFTYQQFLDSNSLTAETHQIQLAQQAARQIAVLLALREISIQESLQATDDQVDAEFDRLLTENVIAEDQYEEYRLDSRRRLQVANALIQQRLHDFLFAHNTINAVEMPLPDPDAEPDAGSAGPSENAASAPIDAVYASGAAAEATSEEAASELRMESGLAGSTAVEAEEQTDAHTETTKEVAPPTE